MSLLELLLKEREEFINGMKLQSQLFLKNMDDYYFGMEKAFDDAFNQYARREKKKYATDKRILMKPVVERLFSYFNNTDDEFDDCFNDCIELSKGILDNNRCGMAQKFTNMSFKYLYCYSDALDYEKKFADCHMPLDKYTINWIKSLKNREINKKLGAISSAWANIDQDLYNDIQAFVTTTLNPEPDYTISFNKQATVTACKLPKNKLYAEFIIWHQEKINELYGILKKRKADFDRLGIKWIE